MDQKVIQTKKVADEVVERLEQMVVEGVFVAGSKLPAERKLAEQLGVSRPSLREALKKLAAKGLVVTKQGSGTFIAETIGLLFKDPILNLYEESPDAQKDLLEFRHTLEAACAFYAAQRATSLDLERLTQVFKALEQCYLNKQSTQSEEASADAHFHLVIAEASHNVVLLQVMRMLFDLVKQNIVISIGGLHTYSESTRDQLMQQHRAMYQAIMQGKAEEAKLAATEHLSYVKQVLGGVAEERRRVDQSVRRQCIVEGVNGVEEG